MLAHCQLWNSRTGGEGEAVRCKELPNRHTQPKLHVRPCDPRVACRAPGGAAAAPSHIPALCRPTGGPPGSEPGALTAPPHASGGKARPLMAPNDAEFGILHARQKTNFGAIRQTPKLTRPGCHRSPTVVQPVEDDTICTKSFSMFAP